MGAKRYAAAQKLLEAAGFKEKQMAEWNLTPQEENRLESVARDEALLSQEAHSYLPTTPDEAARFNPHEWVGRLALRQQPATNRKGWSMREQHLDVIQLRCDKALADRIYAVSRATGVTPDDVASVLAWLALRPMLASHMEPAEDVES